MIARLLWLVLFAVLKTSGQADSFAGIDKLLMPFATADAPGMSVAIIQDAKLIYSKNIGVADVASNREISASTVFNTGSVAKQFTAACIWVLVFDKKISVQDDIRKYLPEMPVSDPPIRITNLLDHSSGIRNYHTLMDLQGFDYDTEYYNNQTVLELAARQIPPIATQRHKTLYSNTNYNLLALIIERVSGQNLNDFATRHIFRPLKMNATVFRVSADQKIPNRGNSYTLANNTFSLVPDVIQESYGAGNLWSSTEDMARWINLLTQPTGKYKSLRDFLTYIEKASVSKYARGVMVDEFKGYKTIGHSGSDYGWNANIVAVPDQKLGVVILSNSNRQNPSALTNSILDLLLQDKPKPVASDLSASQIDISRFAGHYREINSDMHMDIFVENDSLKSRGANANKAIALLALGTHRFYRINNPGIQYDFSGSSDGDMIISFNGNPFYFNRATVPTTSGIRLQDFEGDYYSEELQTAYRFHISGERLLLSFRNNPDMPLSPVDIDAFGNGRRTLYRFTRDVNHNVTGLLLSCEGNVNNIMFSKQ